MVNFVLCLNRSFGGCVVGVWECLKGVWGLIGGVCEISERYLEGVLKVSDGRLLGIKMVCNC